MGVSEFELFHGIVLTKLLRSQRPVTLRMIETRPGEAWSAYTINDEVDLFIKHSTAGRRLTRAEGGVAWSFVFGPGQLRQMRDSLHPVYVALVGGAPRVKAKDMMQVCLLDTEQVAHVIDLSSSTQQAITVRYVPRHQLRVFKGKQQKYLVPQCRLEDWQVPGS